MRVARGLRAEFYDQSQQVRNRVPEIEPRGLAFLFYRLIFPCVRLPWPKTKP
jgi:hypothetical protein